MLHIVAWGIPIIGGLVVFVTLQSRGQLAWQNRNLEHAIETLAEYSDKPDIDSNEP